MQVSSERRSNPQRTAEMRRRLLAAARSLFVEKGYADTGTPEIVAAAGVTRGALYHHFEDKQALFRAVVESEAAAVAAAIEAAAAAAIEEAAAPAADGAGTSADRESGGEPGALCDGGSGFGASGRSGASGNGDGAGGALARLLAGAAAYLTAMAVPGRTRLLLIEAPAVLGNGAMRGIDGSHAERTLREGLQEAMQADALAPLPLEPLTALLSAMFDRAALDAAAASPPEATLRVIKALLTGLAPPQQGGAGG